MELREDRELHQLVEVLVRLLVIQQWQIQQYQGSHKGQIVLLCWQLEQTQQGAVVPAFVLLTLEHQKGGIVVGIGEPQALQQVTLVALPVSVLVEEEQKRGSISPLFSIISRFMEQIALRQMDAVELLLPLYSYEQLLQEAEQIIHVRERMQASSNVLAALAGKSSDVRVPVAVASATRQEVYSQQAREVTSDRQGFSAISSSPSQEASEELREWGKLVIYRGEEIPLRQAAVVVGREMNEWAQVKPDINLQGITNATTVSRRHARLEHLGNLALITDLGSANGTYVNGKPLVPDHPAFLNDGDRIEIGRLRCFFHTPADREA